MYKENVTKPKNKCSKDYDYQKHPTKVVSIYDRNKVKKQTNNQIKGKEQ